MPKIEDSSATREIVKKIEPINNPVNPHGLAGAEPVYPTFPRFSVTALPLSAIYQPDALRGFYRGGVPQSRLIPRQS
jgi:hypothetical protein